MASAIVATGVLITPHASAEPTITTLRCAYTGGGVQCFLDDYQATAPFTIRWYVNGVYKSQFDDTDAAAGPCVGTGATMLVVLTDPTGSTSALKGVRCSGPPDPVRAIG
ncbi:MAG TPA: hypothetical protein VGD67_00630 [Pseudonocardiaceae bacterium]